MFVPHRLTFSSIKRASSKQSLEKSEGHCRNDALENWLGQVAVEKVLYNVVQLNLRLTTAPGISNQQDNLYFPAAFFCTRQSCIDVSRLSEFSKTPLTYKELSPHSFQPIRLPSAYGTFLFSFQHTHFDCLGQHGRHLSHFVVEGCLPRGSRRDGTLSICKLRSVGCNLRL